MKKIILLGERLMVTPDPISEKIDSTLDLLKPESVQKQEKPSTGTVELVSDGCQFVKAGDRIHFNKWAGLEVEITGQLNLVGVKKKTFLILSESEVMMITERPE